MNGKKYYVLNEWGIEPKTENSFCHCIVGPATEEDELNDALKKLSKINKELDLDKKENIPDTSVQKNDTGVDRKSKVNRMR